MASPYPPRPNLIQMAAKYRQLLATGVRPGVIDQLTRAVEPEWCELWGEEIRTVVALIMAEMTPDECRALAADLHARSRPGGEEEGAYDRPHVR
jgi:hypothetical protein